MTHLTIKQIEEGKSVFKEEYKELESHLTSYTLHDNHPHEDLYQMTQGAINLLESNTHGHSTVLAEKHLTFLKEVKEKHDGLLPHVKLFFKHVISTITRKHLR